MEKVQVYLSGGVLGRVAQAAKAEGRSVSQWLRLLVERELDGRDWAAAAAPLSAVDLMERGVEDMKRRVDLERPARVIPAVKALMEEPSVVVSCPHDRLRKEPGMSGGLVKVCQDCGERGL